MSVEPRINPEFPIKEPTQLSPPVVGRPIHQCAEIVSVTGFVPHATVRVYANLNDLVGEDAPAFGFADVLLKRPLKLGESITATQTVNNLTSDHSIIPVVVSDYPGLTTPVVGAEIFECGHVVPVGELVPSVTVHVMEDGQEIGSAPTAGTWCPVVTKSLNANAKVTAIQVACENSPGLETASHESDPVVVNPAPDPVPSPAVDQQSLIVGNDVVTLTNLYTGAGVAVFDGGVPVGGGYATGAANWCPISGPLTANSSITATQELCVKSLPSTPETPKGELTAPVVIGPICAGASFVIIRDTVVNANVVLRRGGSIIGYGGAVPGDLVLAIGGNVQLKAGDAITAVQTMGQTVSPVSNTVTVVGKLEVPAIEIDGGEPFFAPRPTDQAIDGPVFPRGRGSGPLIKIQACCTKDVHVSILDPGGSIVAKPEPVEVFPGYYSAQWDWKSMQGWNVPTDIPIGAYSVVVNTGCDQKEAKARFYVIFNPADVNGPARFSFDETAIWFAAGSNFDFGLLYHLHPSDTRVFGWAIQVASGMTDPRKAAEALSPAVYARWNYSVSVSYNDVIDLIEHATEAQCADEACCLVALLRAIGIPAHPVTADAASEVGAMNWGFDTWTEFLVPGAGGTEWLVLHPHEYPNDPAATRQDFGANKGVATNATDDLIIMANANWVWNEADDYSADISYARNECGQPLQQVNAKPWVDHICEQGYWAQPHWDCTGVTSSAIRAPRGFRLEGRALRFGGEVAGSVTLESLDRVLTAERVTIELVSHRREIKGFPTETFDGVSHRLLLEAGREATVPFRLRLPPSIAPGSDLYLHLRVGERTLLLSPLRPPSALECELRMPAELRLGDRFTITGLVRNVGREAVNGISLALKVPYAIRARRLPVAAGVPEERATGGSARLVTGIDSLPPGAERTIEWAAQAESPAPAASVRLEVGSQDGGPALSVVPVRVIGPGRIPVIARPVAPRQED